MTLRSADKLMAVAVEKTLAALALTDADAAAVMLARRYAEAIDAASDLAAVDRLGPKLFTVLESLGATPSARGKAVSTSGPSRPSRLQQLREAHHGTGA